LGGKVDDCRRQQITRGTTPRPTTTDTFAWVGSSALPCHINAMGSEATSLLELLADATHTRVCMGIQEPTRQKRMLHVVHQYYLGSHDFKPPDLP
jgi:hypothetical protein